MDVCTYVRLSERSSVLPCATGDDDDRCETNFRNAKFRKFFIFLCYKNNNLKITQNISTICIFIIQDKIMNINENDFLNFLKKYLKI